MYTPNFFLRHPEACNKAGREDLRGHNKVSEAVCSRRTLTKQEVTSRLTKLGANTPRLALLALVEIHSSRFVALLRMTIVRWGTVGAIIDRPIEQRLAALWVSGCGRALLAPTR